MSISVNESLGFAWQTRIPLAASTEFCWRNEEHYARPNERRMLTPHMWDRSAPSHQFLSSLGWVVPENAAHGEFREHYKNKQKMEDNQGK